MAHDEGRLAKPDRELLELVAENDWILIKFDEGFLTLIESAGLAHAGVVFLSQAGKDIGDVVKAIDAHLAGRYPADRSVHYG